jgi:hypothetical protein
VFAEPGSSDPPRLRYPATFDWDTLARYNFVDLGMLAHRSRQDHRFDEDLPAFLDWDYVVRLTLNDAPQLVPALSGIYFTDAPNRISHQVRRDLQQELQRRFSLLRSTPSRPKGTSGTSPDDLGALEVMLRRLADESNGRLDILEVGSPQVSDALADAGSNHAVNWNRSEDVNLIAFECHYDLVIVDGLADQAIEDLLKPEGLIVGLDAHRIAYGDHHPSLRYQRRLGDALWVGSADRSDLETLFPSVALTKLGYDHPPDPADGAGLKKRG